jgi:hypothetical protein
MGVPPEIFDAVVADVRPKQAKIRLTQTSDQVIAAVQRGM